MHAHCPEADVTECAPPAAPEPVEQGPRRSRITDPERMLLADRRTAAQELYARGDEVYREALLAVARTRGWALEGGTLAVEDTSDATEIVWTPRAKER